VCGVSGMAVHSGVTKSGTDAAQLALRIAAIAAGAAAGGPAGATTAVSMTSGGGSSAPPQNAPTPPVATHY
jgi:hypothetical protein